NDDERIEETIERFDHRHEPLDVGIRRIALKRRRLDTIDRQRHDQDGLAAKRIAIGAEHHAAVALDERRERVGRAGLCAGLFRREADRRGLLLLSADRLLLFGHAGAGYVEIAWRWTCAWLSRSTSAAASPGC